MIDRHLDDHLRTIARLRDHKADIEAIAGLMIDCLASGGRIFWLGNGGSAADSQHLASELVGRFERDRPGLASLALTTDSSALTAIGNDYGFDQIFAARSRPCAGRGIWSSASAPPATALMSCERWKRRAPWGP